MIEQLFQYWSGSLIAVNLVVLANIAFALVLGMLVGYERTFRGRAAGMRTYGLVCMASCAVTVIGGFPNFWYGSHALNPVLSNLPPDPTRVIQGVLTGIGFLGAGVIMRDGFTISGLTTAASLWSSSAIGILTGIGFYSAAIVVTLLSIALMLVVARVERRLPSRHAIAIMLRFKAGYASESDTLKRVAQERGYRVLDGSMNVRYADGCMEWRYVAVAKDHRACVSVDHLAAELGRFQAVDRFEISNVRN